MSIELVRGWGNAVAGELSERIGLAGECNGLILYRETIEELNDGRYDETDHLRDG